MNEAVDTRPERRFEFGRNWQAFLSTLDERRIAEAERSLLEMLGRGDLRGLRFLDVGSGSGLFSLAARRLGATVTSFDFDSHSVECTRSLKERYFRTDPQWTIARGSVLDRPFLAALGQFDVVYAWGVLHHTGAMWQSMEIVDSTVRAGGCLFLALYNDRGWISRMWKIVKRLYCSGSPGRLAVLAVFVPYFALRSLAAGMVLHGHPLGHFREYHRKRGMSLYHDWIDWLGGYPYEVARPAEVEAFFSRRGYDLARRSLTRRLGCNEFVFRKRP